MKRGKTENGNILQRSSTVQRREGNIIIIVKSTVVVIVNETGVCNILTIKTVKLKVSSNNLKITYTFFFSTQLKTIFALK